MIEISNSEIATWDRCRRQWYLKYYLGAVPEEEPPVGAAILGTRVHAAMEGLYGYGLDPEDVLGALYAIAIDAAPDWKTELLAERELAAAMVTGYLEWTAETGADAALRVVATEREVKVPLPGVPGVMLKARMDQVVIDEETGRLAFLDHKTAASFDTHDLLAMHPQFKFYSIVQKLAAPPGGPLVMGGILNTLRKVKRTEKSKPPYYQRDTFFYTEEMLGSAMDRVTAVCQQIMSARWVLDWAYGEQQGALATVNSVQRSEMYPSPRLHECRWDCPFVTLCPMMDDGSDWPGALLRSGKYRQQDPYSYYYKDDPLQSVRDKLGFHGEVATGEGP